MYARPNGEDQSKFTVIASMKFTAHLAQITTFRILLTTISNLNCLMDLLNRFAASRMY